MTSLHSFGRSRSLIVGVTSVALLGLPALSSASVAAPTESSAQPGQAAVAAARRNTSIRFLNFDRTREHGSTTAVRGQVITKVGGKRGAIAGVRVSLYRRLGGSSNWAFLGNDYTSKNSHPSFLFSARSKANARYRVVYRGNKNFQGSRDSASVSVFRTVTGRLKDGSGRFHGRVSPDFGRKKLSLQRRACPSCGWKSVRNQRTNSRGGYHFTLGAPARGRTFWRIRTPATSKFITSYSGVYTTRRV